MLNVTNILHCKECAVKTAISIMASCGFAAWIGMGSHGNENKGCWYSADNPGNYVGLLPGKNFLLENVWVIKFIVVSEINYLISVTPWIIEEKWPLRSILEFLWICFELNIF